MAKVFAPNPSLDLQFIEKSALFIFKNEASYLDAAKRDGDYLLEMEDFYSDGSYRFPETRVSDKPSAEKLFLKYRKEVVIQIVKRRAEALQEIWPKIDLDHLGALVAKYSVGILDISTMIDLLFAHLLKESDFINKSKIKDEAIYFNAIIWLQEYTREKAQGVWVADKKDAVNEPDPPPFPDSSVDLSFAEDAGYVALKSIYSAVEMARCDNDPILELSDFDPDKGCGKEVSGVSDPHSGELAFYRMRAEAAKSMALFWGIELQEKWPGLDVKMFGDIFALYSQGVRDVWMMGSGLKKAMLLQEGHYDEKEILIFAMTWMNIFVLGEVHDGWIKKGETPILPSSEMEGFVQNSLDRLTLRKIRLVKQPGEFDNTFQASYDPASNSLMFPPRYFDNPYISPIDVNATISIVAHELYHAEQDAQQRDRIFAEAEIECYLLGTKIDIMINGMDKQEKRVLEQSEEMEKKLREENDRMKPMKHPYKLWLSYYLNPNNPEGLNTIQFNRSIFALARKELETKETDREGRNFIQHRFALFKSDMLLTQFIYNLSQQYEANPVTFMLELKRSMDAVGFLENLSPTFLHIEKTNSFSMIFAATYFESLVQTIFGLYLFGGEVAAQDYFDNKLVPQFYGDFVKAFEKTEIVMDGV